MTGERQQLGARIRSLIDRQQIYSVNRISQLTSTDRSSLYQILDGRRLPTPKFLKDFIHVLHLPEHEIRELYDLYHICRDGRWAVSRNREVLSILSRICEASSPSISHTLTPPPRENTVPVTGALSTFAKLQDALCLLLGHEIASQAAPGVCVMLSTPSLLAMDFLPLAIRHCAFPEGRRLRLIQIVEINRSQTVTPDQMDVAAFLEPLRHMVSVYCNDNVQYEPSISYTDIPLCTQPGILFPNYVLFSDHVLLIDADGKSGVCIASQTIASSYRQRFLQSRSYTQCVEMQGSSFQSILKEYINFTDDLQPAGEHYTFSFSPVLYPQYTRELLEKYVHSSIPNRSQMIDGIQQYYGAWDQTSRQTRHYILFSEEGLMQFAREGISSEIPPQLVRPVEPADRPRLFPCPERQPWNTYVMLKPGVLEFPRRFSICVGNQSLLFTDERYEKRFDSLAIRDPRMIALFTETFQSLIASENAYTPEEQAERWERARRACSGT